MNVVDEEEEYPHNNNHFLNELTLHFKIGTKRLFIWLAFSQRFGAHNFSTPNWKDFEILNQI